MVVAIDLDELAIIIAENLTGTTRPPGISASELVRLAGEASVVCNYRAAAQAATKFIFDTVMAHAAANQESVQ